MRNDLYAKVYARNWNDERASLVAIRKQLQTQFDEAILTERKKRQPTRRTRFDDLPEKVHQDILDKVKGSALMDIHDRLKQTIEDEKTKRENLLEAMASGVKMVPDDAWHRLDTSTSLSHGSQGYGAMKYAKGRLLPLLDMLMHHGFAAKIRRTNYRSATGAFGIPHADFELWANCPHYMFDAARRQLSLADAVASMKARQLNPLVYSPLLPDSCRL